jgi:sugar lactone lactonase YvrE
VSESATNIIHRVHMGDPADASTWSFEAYAGSGTAGSGDGAVATATFRGPSALAFSPVNKTLYVADTGNHTIRAVDTVSNTVATYAGIAGLLGFSGDGGEAKSSLLRDPSGLALATDGRSLYIADTDNHRVRYVDDAGTIHTVTGTGLAVTSGSNVQAGSATMAGPVGLAVDSFGNLFIAGRGSVRIVAAGGDGLALANDVSDIVYGATDDYPSRVTDCLSGMTLDSTEAHAYVVDSCRGYVLDLARQ